jgi:hypothetical protein
MSARTVQLRIADVLRIVADAACDETKQVRLKRIELAQFPKTYYRDADKDEYLLQVPTEMREDLKRYYFFSEGYLFEIHKADYPNKYSFISFPKAYEEQRMIIQERFISAATHSEACLEWFEGMKWEDVSDELRAYLRPIFVEDDAKAPLM